METQTLEQRRVGHVLACVERVKKNASLAGKYRSYVEALPTHIVMGGLGQAVATEWAAARMGEQNREDGPKAHEQLARDLEDWLGQTAYHDSSHGQSSNSGWLLKTIVENDQKPYLHAQAEALAWLVWLKKLCQANLPKTAED